MTLSDIIQIYDGSDGDATMRLYGQLEAIGPAGQVALNLFRANKASARAKVYRGGAPGRGSYRGMAYDRKGWAMRNLAEILAQHAGALSITWGWAIDEAQPYHRHVLYVDIPTGQVSFHAAERGDGPDYAGTWDQFPNASAGRVCTWIARLLGGPQ